MRPEETTLYSGGARGAEAAFGELAEKYGLAEVNFTFEGHHIQRNAHARPLSDGELAKANVSMAEVSKRLGRDFSMRPWMLRILQSIWYQVNNGYQVFIVGTIQEDGTVKGGTGWAAELAKLYNRPLYVFDQEKGQWYAWKADGWKEETPILSHRTVCGTGTRQLTDVGKQALEELFARSFSLASAVGY
ncbi:MAG: hypothetical protein HY900_22335 [Deltaproteobacteria bacterium]|nr:hypothetical protein [Deltaproteobacteria bacterium]